MKKFELLSATALAFVVAQPAIAQNTSGAAATEGDGADIIVTATKRERTLQDTPVAVSVTSGEQIQRAQIRDLIDLQSLVPSLKVGQLQSSANTNFIIRGFGNGANNPGIEPSVGVFIDGVYRSRSAAQIADLPNLKRVEVLRGPQSTLFGKNASAGVISIITAEPQFKFGGSAELSYGNYNAIVAKADVTGPLSETLAFSIAGNYNKRDGYFRDLNLGSKINDRNRYGVRGQLLWQPNADLKFRLIGDYDKIDEICCGLVNVTDGPINGSGVTAATILNSFIAPAGTLKVNKNNPYSLDVYNNLNSTTKQSNGGISLQGDYDMGKFALTSVTSYRTLRKAEAQDADFTSADLLRLSDVTNIDTFTQEVRLASKLDGPLNFLVGAFYFSEKVKDSNDIQYGKDLRAYANVLTQGGISSLETALAIPAGTFQKQGTGIGGSFSYKDDSISLFGQADFELGEHLTLTAGFNYTDDRKTVSSNFTSTDVFSGVDLVQVGFAQGLAGQGVNPNNAAAVALFAQNNPATYAAIVAGSQNPSVNTALGLRGLQFAPPFLNFPNAVESGKSRDKDFSYTLRAAYKFSSHLNAYVTYATGFKPSSWNLSRDSRPFATDFTPGSAFTNPAPSAIRTAGLATPNLATGSRYALPEKSTVYEAGIKGSFRNFGFNLAVFKQIIKDFQSNAFFGTGFALTNAGKQSVFGVELDGRMTPTKDLTFTFALTYLDPKYDSFLKSSEGDLTGQRPAPTSEYSLTVGAQYRHEFDNGSAIGVGWDYDHSSNTQTRDGARWAGYRFEQNIVNGTATFELNRNLAFTVWGRNITDDKFIYTLTPTPVQSNLSPGFLGSVSGYRNQPRTFGGTVRYKF